MNWDDIWFALPNFSPERATLLSIGWGMAARHGDSALLSNLQINTLDGFGVCNQLRYARIPVPTEALRLVSR